MADGITAKAEGGWNAIKKHWVAFLLLAGLVAIGVLAYDKKNAGKATSWAAGLPGIGKLFT